MSKPSNAQLAKAFAVHIASKGYSPNTHSRYRRYVLEWSAFAGRHRFNLLDASPSQAATFWDEMMPRYNPNTIRQALSCLHTFYKWAQIHYRAVDPFVVITPPAAVEPALRPIIGPDQLVELVTGWVPIDWKEHRDRAALAILASTGARNAEFRAVNPEHVDYRRRAVWLAAGKACKPAWAPLLASAAEIVRDWDEQIRPNVAAAGERALIVNDWGYRCKAHTVVTIVKRVSQRLGIEIRLTPHGVRASAITAVYEHSKDPVAAQDYGRHRNFNVTDKHYIRRSPTRVVDVGEAHHPLSF